MEFYIYSYRCWTSLQCILSYYTGIISIRINILIYIVYQENITLFILKYIYYLIIHNRTSGKFLLRCTRKYVLIRNFKRFTELRGFYLQTKMFEEFPRKIITYTTNFKINKLINASILYFLNIYY